MAKYAEEQPQSTTRTPVPDDLPDPAKEIARGIKPGSIIVSDEVRESDGKPRQFRLQAERKIPALWREIVPRPVNTATAAVEEDDEVDDTEDDEEEDDAEDDVLPPPPVRTKRHTRRTA